LDRAAGVAWFISGGKSRSRYTYSQNDVCSLDLSSAGRGSSNFRLYPKGAGYSEDPYGYIAYRPIPPDGRIAEPLLSGSQPGIPEGEVQFVSDLLSSPGLEVPTEDAEDCLIQRATVESHTYGSYEPSWSVSFKEHNGIPLPQSRWVTGVKGLFSRTNVPTVTTTWDTAQRAFLEIRRCGAKPVVVTLSFVVPLELYLQQ